MYQTETNTCYAQCIFNIIAENKFNDKKNQIEQQIANRLMPQKNNQTYQASTKNKPCMYKFDFHNELFFSS